MKRKGAIAATKCLLYLLILTVLFVGLYFYLQYKNMGERISSALDKNEILIDYIIDESLSYTLINKEGTDEYGDFFVVFKKKNDIWNRIYENDFKELMPWKLELADVDGDDNKDILVAVRKTTRYDMERKNRMFIFNYQEGILSKKWTGSQIAGTWRDFYPMDILPASGDELVFIEQTEDGRERISIYSWFDFGFFRLAVSETYPEIRHMVMTEDKLLEITYYEEGKERSQTLQAANGKLIAKES